MKSKLLSVLFWSIVSAAFIGPGTLATAAAAGALYQYKLLWALVFATAACIVLQETSSRITIASGRQLGGILRDDKNLSLWMSRLVMASVMLGCVAYEAGNILGAMKGLTQLIPMDRQLAVLLIGGLCGLLLAIGKIKTIANILGLLVAAMGLGFILVAVNISTGNSSWVTGLIPTYSAGEEWLILGLLGTTVVPYNVFLASGLSPGQKIPLMRFGIVVSIILGGLVSMAILIVGTSMTTFTNFDQLSSVMSEKLGPWAGMLTAFGLFAAGLTSAVTAPLAAGFIWQGMRGAKSTTNIKPIAFAVLIVGIAVGISGVQPIPVIIAAQALNGFVLPGLALILILYANDQKLLTATHVNTRLMNILSILILNVLLVIGFNNILNAVFKMLNIPQIAQIEHIITMQAIALPIVIWVSYVIYQRRRK